MLVTIQGSLQDQIQHDLILYSNILFKFYLDSYD